MLIRIGESARLSATLFKSISWLLASYLFGGQSIPELAVMDGIVVTPLEGTAVTPGWVVVLLDGATTPIVFKLTVKVRMVEAVARERKGTCACALSQQQRATLATQAIGRCMELQAEDARDSKREMQGNRNRLKELMRINVLIRPGEA